MIPFLALWGDGGCGISAIAKSITTQWFQHLGSQNDLLIEVLTSSLSFSQAKEYLSSINLGMCFDDIDKDWGSEIGGILKSMLTNITTRLISVLIRNWS